MNKYLLQILKDTNTVIIPELGALTITNEKTGEIMFISYLKYDDGKLVGFISEKDGLELNDAKNVVAKYVREIQAKIDKGESYDMFQFGSFFKKEDGEIDFKQWNEANDSAINETVIPEVKSEDTEPKSIKEEKIIEETPIAKTIDEILSKTAVSVEIQKVEEVIQEQIEEKKPIIEPEVLKEVEKQAEKTVESVKPISTPTTNSSDIKENIYISPEELKNQESEEKKVEEIEIPLAVKNTVKEIKDQKKRGVGFFIGLILIVLIVLSAIGTAIFYQQVKSLIPFLNKENQEIQLDDKVVVDEVEDSLDEIYKDTLNLENTSSENDNSLQPEKIEKTEEKTSQKPSPAPVQQNGSFHVIAGSFSTEANALRFVEELKTKNTSSEYIGKYGMYLVSYGSYSSTQEAIKAMKAAGQSGWIKKID